MKMFACVYQEDTMSNVSIHTKSIMDCRHIIMNVPCKLTYTQ